jgi:folate-dependent phosphoribosylglycinamide formyltransferase PurN
VSTSSNPEFLGPGPRRPHRVVALCSHGPLERNTCATLVRAGVNLVGIVWCSRPGLKARAHFLLRWATRHGALHTAGQILGRLYDRARNGRWDRRVLAHLVDDAADRATLEGARLGSIQTDSYSRPDTLAAIGRLDPDILVVHTKYIVGAKPRMLAPVAVIGGHPGITPWYRGAYSPFWALLHGRPDMIGFSVFLVDDGIDTGPVLFQERLPVVPGEDSHVTLAWKGIQRQSTLQAKAILRLDAGECLPLRRLEDVPDDSYFTLPTLTDFLRYRRRQRLVR